MSRKFDEWRYRGLPVMKSGNEKPRRIAPAGSFAERRERHPIRLDRYIPGAARAANSNNATMLVILIIGLTAGPAVSL